MRAYAPRTAYGDMVSALRAARLHFRSGPGTLGGNIRPYNMKSEGGGGSRGLTSIPQQGRFFCSGEFSARLCFTASRVPYNLEIVRARLDPPAKTSRRSGTWLVR